MAQLLIIVLLIPFGYVVTASLLSAGWSTAGVLAACGLLGAAISAAVRWVRTGTVRWAKRRRAR